MSFLNRVGLGFLDPTNELDKFANAIKDGDVSEIVEKIGNLFETVEDRLEDIAEVFEGETTRAKEAQNRTMREERREQKREIRGIVRQAKADIAEAQKVLGDKLMAALKATVAEEVAAQLAALRGVDEPSMDDLPRQ